MRRPVQLGCLHGCPLGYHEDDCPEGQRLADLKVAERRAPSNSYERGYAEGFAAGYQTALRELETRQHAQRRAREETTQPRQVVRVERLDAPKEIQ